MLVPGPRIFISYRRDDAAAYAGRIHDRLSSAFGSDVLFIDVDGIPLGENFAEVLREEVGRCSALLAIIGDEWLDTRDERGQRRLDNEDDFVRIEIAAALERRVPVIPVLLDDTKIPPIDLLPEDIKGLSYRNGLQVRHRSFHADIDKLIADLKKRFAASAQTSTVPAAVQTKPASNKRTLWAAMAIVGATLVVWTAWYSYDSYRNVLTERALQEKIKAQEAALAAQKSADGARRADEAPLAEAERQQRCRALADRARVNVWVVARLEELVAVRTTGGGPRLVQAQKDLRDEKRDGDAVGRLAIEDNCSEAKEIQREGRKPGWSASALALDAQAAERIRAYQASPSGQEVEKWMKSNGIYVPLGFFLRSEDQADARQRIIANLNIP